MCLFISCLFAFKQPQPGKQRFCLCPGPLCLATSFMEAWPAARLAETSKAPSASMLSASTTAAGGCLTMDALKHAVSRQLACLWQTHTLQPVPSARCFAVLLCRLRVMRMLACCSSQAPSEAAALSAELDRAGTASSGNPGTCCDPICSYDWLVAHCSARQHMSQKQLAAR